MFSTSSFLHSSEVLKALHNTRELYERWRAVDEGRDIRSIEEQEWAATELRNALRSIEWDLEDLDDTVQIVEKNPAKFRIDAAELAVRKGFITSTRDEVSQMKRRTEGKHASAAAAAGSTEEVCGCEMHIIERQQESGWVNRLITFTCSAIPQEIRVYLLLITYRNLNVFST